MKQRIFSAAAILILLGLVIGFSWVPFVVNAAAAAVAVLGLFEIIRVSIGTKHPSVTAGAMIFTGLFVFCSTPMIPNYREWLTLATFLLILAAFAYYLRGYRALRPDEMMFVMMMTMIMSYFFSAVVLIRTSAEHGLWYLILIFLLAWIPDTGAYLCGSAFGKHKLAPVISPKKTVEGAVGGLVACIGVAYLYAWLLDRFAGVSVNYAILLFYAVFGTGVSILGDLTASLIKRHYKVKDYGNLIPGHGGIMDRFDSVWFVAPFIWLMIGLCPVFY